MEYDILLNCLPPFKIRTPSAALSILKTFLTSYHVKTNIKYWNIGFETIIGKYLNYKEIQDKELLSIFINMGFMNDNDSLIKNKTLLYAYKKNQSISLFEFEKEYTNLTNELNQYISTELDSINFEKIKLFGISFKYNQWIPGIILAKEIKRKYPDVKIVVGGLDNNKIGIQLLKETSCFDFAIWGEGEYSLLLLYEALQKKSPYLKDIPQLIFRDKEEIICNKRSKEILSFENYVYPNYDDYFEQLNKLFPNYPFIQLPINAIRGCNWNRCMFCVSKMGYTYRERNPENVINEIDQQIRKYNITNFEFVDNCSYKNKTDLENFTDKLTELACKLEKYISAEMTITHTGVNRELVEKLFVAGVRRIQIGFESFSDNYLELMDKENRVADNILFIKNALKYNIMLPLILITDIPDESVSDISESINNLHYFRFYLTNKKFFLPFSSLQIQYKSKYYHKLSPEELKKYNFNSIVNLLSKQNREFDSEKIFFQYEKEERENPSEWMKFEKVMKEYKKNQYSYKIIKKNNELFYFEYFNEKEISSLVFDNPHYYKVLELTENKICSYDFLCEELCNNAFKKEDLKVILRNLQSKYLIYSNKDLSQNVSTILLNN